MAFIQIRDFVPSLVSVVIPTYNHAHLLDRALESVKTQSWKAWEILVIDNHSTDNTDQVIQKWLQDVPIKLHKIRNNGVIGASRNKGIQEARGEWVAFLDSDDWWTSDKLERSVSALVAGADLVYHDMYVVRSSDKPSFEEKITSTRPCHPMFDALLCSGFSIPNSSVVVRRHLFEAIGGISEEKDLIAVEDFDTWLRMARVTEKFTRLEGCHGYYWVGASNASAASPKQQERIRALYKKHQNDLPVFKRPIAEGFLAYRVARIAQQHGDLKVAFFNFMKALKSPINSKYRFKAICFLTSATYTWVKSKCL